MARPKFKTRVDMSISRTCGGTGDERSAARLRGCTRSRSSARCARRGARGRIRYYFAAAVVKPFFELVERARPGDVDKAEQAHIENEKRNVLGTRIVRIRGVVSRIVPTTHDMDVAEFMDYVERARHWLREQVGIETLDPGEYGIERQMEGASR
jgi:hypothetical protein